MEVASQATTPVTTITAVINQLNKLSLLDVSTSAVLSSGSLNQICNAQIICGPQSADSFSSSLLVVEQAAPNNWFNNNNNNNNDNGNGDVTFTNASTSNTMACVQGVDNLLNNNNNEAQSDNVMFMSASTSDAGTSTQGIDNNQSHVQYIAAQQNDMNESSSSSLQQSITHTTQTDLTTSALNVTSIDSSTTVPDSSLVAVDNTASGTNDSENHRKRAVPAHSNTEVSNSEITEADECVEGLAPKRRKLSQGKEENHDNEVVQDDDVPMNEDEISDICENEQILAQSGISETEEEILQCCACMFPSVAKKTVQCNKSHIICKACLKPEIIKTVTSDKMNVSCPVALCTEEISLDALKCLQPSFCIDVLIENIYQKQDAASKQAITELKGVVSCPKCQATAEIDDDVIFFKCFNESCKKVSCRYCKVLYVKAQEDHHYYECYLLHFAGTECLKNILVPPAIWNNNDAVNVVKEDGYESVFLQSDSKEWKTITKMFTKTSGSTVNYVFRVQNRKCWETYMLKRKHLIEEIGEENLSERLLYHGTTQDSVRKILKEGFDCRKPSINKNCLGKGNYFSTTANYSEKFAKGANVLLLARVLCGYSAIGKDTNTHPPYAKSGRMFDSCVDELPNPSMYIVYSNDQCYPEYAISYTPPPAPANST